MSYISRVSPSQITKMMKCMRWWYYDYVLHLPSTYKSRFAVGRAFHKSVEKNLENKIATGDLMARPEVLDVASDMFDKESLVVEEWVADRGEEKDACIRVSGHHYDTAASEIQPLMVEKEWAMDVAGIPAIGFMDVVEANRIRDTKFKGSTPPKDKAVEFVQSVIYSKVARMVLGLDVKEFIFDCFVPLKTKVNYIPIRVEPTLEQEERVEYELSTRVKMAEAGLFPRTSPDLGICDYCPHKTYCWKSDKS